METLRRILGLKPKVKPFDLTGIPTHACICGGDTFKIVARFEEGEIVWYALTGYCYECGSRVTVPTPLDVIGVAA